MAAILPIGDRRARLAFFLALLGFPSMGVTVPAAVWLGIGSVRHRNLASGGEPVLGFLSLSISALDLLFIELGIRRLFERVPADAAWTGVAAGAALAVVIVVLANSSLRIHPERLGMVLATRAALLASLGGGTAMFVRLMTAIQT